MKTLLLNKAVENKTVNTKKGGAYQVVSLVRPSLIRLASTNVLVG